MIDGRERVTGRTIYTYDLELPRLLHGKVKRSSLPHAKILSINYEKAARLPGVRAIITASDLPNNLYGAGIRDTSVLAREKVRYVGEPVAAVAADTPDIAEEALELIEVDYEPLKPLFDAEDALREDCDVVLHQNFNGYEMASVMRPTVAGEPPNVCYHFKIRKGNVEDGFRKADLVIENRFTTPMSHSIPLEPPACLARLEPDGGVTVWSSTQAPFRLRQDIKSAYGLDETKVRVIACASSGGYGTKIASHPEAICVGLALKAKRPVRIRYTREETFIATTVKHPFIIEIKDGVKKDGTLVARKIKALLNGGAYSGGSGVWVTRNCAFAAVGAYKIQSFQFDSYRVYTNLPPGGPVRGFGSTQIDFAIESHMDTIAKKLGMDPLELRARNALHEGDVNVIGERMHSISGEECLQRVHENLKPAERSMGPWRIGVGFAEANKYSVAPTAASAVVKVKEDGGIEVFTGASETGQGAHTVVAQIAAEVFKMPVSKVRIFTPNTAISPMDEGGFSSRQTYNSGNAVLMAARRAKDEVLHYAAQRLAASVSDLEMADGQIWIREKPERSIRITDLYENLRFGLILDDVGEFSGKATWFQRVGALDPETGQCTTDRACSFYTSTAQGAEVAVNVETGELKVKRLVCAVDVGRALNPRMVEGQIEGGIAMAMAMALTEEMVFEDGRLVNGDFLHYKPPSSLDMPEIVTIIIENPHKDGPFGAKGAGEAPMLATAPAIANAVFDAVGVRIRDLPLTSEKLLAALKRAHPEGIQ